MLTDSQLQQIMPTLTPQKRQMYLPFLNAIMPQYGITSPLRQAAFLAQIAHESGELKFWEEIWGPTAAQKRYEPPSDLATRLGNTQPGDGKRYKGRGPIQITGRFNYGKYGQLLGLDLVGNPDLASTTQVGFETACQFWQVNGLNELADIPDFTAITKKINGGLNGQADREKYYTRAKQALGATGPLRSFAFSPAAVTDPPSNVGTVKNALPRGQEAIDELANTPDSPSSGSTKAESKKKSAPKLAQKASGMGVKAAKKKPAKPAKPVGKKAAVKKAAKPAGKKAAVKKAAIPATKKAAKKAPAKKVAKKATLKPMKKAAKKPAKKSAKK